MCRVAFGARILRSCACWCRSISSMSCRIAEAGLRAAHKQERQQAKHPRPSPSQTTGAKCSKRCGRANFNHTWAMIRSGGARRSICQSTLPHPGYLDTCCASPSFVSTQGTGRGGCRTTAAVTTTTTNSRRCSSPCATWCCCSHAAGTTHGRGKLLHLVTVQAGLRPTVAKAKPSHHQTDVAELEKGGICCWLWLWQGTKQQPARRYVVIPASPCPTPGCVSCGSRLCRLAIHHSGAPFYWMHAHPWPYANPRSQL